jgi:hypothetical protein
MRVSPKFFRRYIVIASILAVAILLVSLTGCNLLGLEEEDEAPLVTDPDAIAGMEVLGGMMEAIFEGGGEPEAGETFPDYASGTYPAGMSVSVTPATDRSVALSVTATNVTPPDEEGGVPEDVSFDGTFKISFTLNDDGTQMTIAVAGSFTASGSDKPFSTMSVTDAVATVPITNEGPGEPSGMTGTLTVDGTAYDMARIDLDGGTDDGGSADPAQAHYFLFGYRDDGGTTRPQIVYSETTDRWDMIDLSGTGYIRAAAADGNGLVVAVGDNGMIYSSADGATWEDRSVSSVSATLYEVRTSGGTWIAAGDEVILRSTNGTSWTEEWTGTSGEILHAVASDGQGNWVASGAPPHILVRSSNDGTAWTPEEADLSNRTPEIIQRLFWTTDDTPLIALSGSHWSDDNSGGIYDGAELDDPPDGLDWTINGSAFAAVAGAERDGVLVAVGSSASGVTLRYSSDNGDSWTSASVSGSINGDFVDMKAIGNGFLATTNMGGLLRGTADATTWQVIRDESYGSWALAYRP